jgi:hypothetical protein
MPPQDFRCRKARSRSDRRDAVCARRARVAQPHPQLDPEILLDDLEMANLVRRGNNAFGEAEAEREILQILRRRHHHGIGAAIIGEGDRDLLGNDSLAVDEPLRPPGRARDTR